jgi:hypothetical protein
VRSCVYSCLRVRIPEGRWRRSWQKLACLSLHAGWCRRCQVVCMSPQHVCVVIRCRGTCCLGCNKKLKVQLGYAEHRQQFAVSPRRNRVGRNQRPGRHSLQLSSACSQEPPARPDSRESCTGGVVWWWWWWWGGVRDSTGGAQGWGYSARARARARVCGLLHENA